jgi:hypothetical protein
MKRNLLLSLALLFVAALALGATPMPTKTPPLQSVATTSTAPLPVKAFLASLQEGEGHATTLAPDGAPYGAHFVDVDWDCVNSCQDDWSSCSQSCYACDQCSCQLARCVSYCGMPYQGC